ISVPLIKNERLIAALSVTSLTARQWTPAEVELVTETAERTWAAVERARAEEALRESEAKFRALYASIDEGFYLAEVIRDEAGKMIDILYLEENPAAIRMIGQTAKGRLWSELDSDYEQYWLDIFDQT